MSEETKLKPVLIKTKEIYKAEWNYKEDDPVMLEKLKANIQKNGVVQTSIVYEAEDGRYILADGNHRKDVFEDLGIEDVWCYNLGKVNPAFAKRIAVEINETRFANNPQRLIGLIDELKAEYEIEDLELTFPLDLELEELPDVPDLDWEEETYEKNEYIIIRFNNKEKFDEVCEVLELSKHNRSIDYKEFLTKWRT